MELNKILRDDALRGCPVLIIANRKDGYYGAGGPAVPLRLLIQGLHLNVIKNREWHCIECAHLQLEPLREGVEWLARMLFPADFKTKY